MIFRFSFYFISSQDTLLSPSGFIDVIFKTNSKQRILLKYWKTITKYTDFVVLDEKNVQEEQAKSQNEQAKPDEKVEPNKATESSKGNKAEEGSKGNNSEK